MSDAFRPLGDNPRITTFHGMSLDGFKQSVQIDGETIHTTRAEWLVLQLLAENDGRPVTAAMLSERIRHSTGADDSDAVQSHISHLRKKLPKLYMIRNIGTPGYKLEYTGRIPTN